jgi:uncharacterized protein YbaA (DUF1428 family)
LHTGQTAPLFKAHGALSVGEGWKRVMADPRRQPGAMGRPFDGKRLIYAGFEVMLQQP